MAANLTPEQLAWLRSQVMQGGMPNAGTITASDGNTFRGGFSGGQPGPEGSQSDWNLDWLLQDVVPGRNNPGDLAHVYDTQGNYSTTAAVPKQSLIPMEILLPLLAAGGAWGMGLGGGAGAGVATSGATGTLPALEMASMGGLESLPMYEMGAGGLGAAGAGAGALSGGGGGAMSFGVLDPTVPFGATASSLGATGSGIGGLLGKYGGLAAAGLGALAGSQGQEQNQSSTKKMDPRLDPYYFGGQGQQGLLPMAMGLLQQQNSPEKMAQWDKMSNIGMGLLSKPRVQYFGGR